MPLISKDVVAFEVPDESGGPADAVRYGTTQALTDTQKATARDNIGFTYGIVPADDTAAEIKAPYVSKTTLVFPNQVSLTDTLDLTGMNSKTLVSMVPHGTAAILSNVAAGPAIALAGSDLTFEGNWRIQKSGTEQGVGIEFTGPSQRIRYDFLWLERFGTGLKAHMSDGDLDLLIIENLFMRQMIDAGFDLKGVTGKVTNVYVGNMSLRRYNSGGDNAEWFRIGKGCGSGGNNALIQTGAGLVYGGKHFLHMVTDEAAVGYSFADTPRKVRFGKVGLRATTGHAIWLEHGQEVFLECNIDQPSPTPGTVGHGVLIDKHFQGDYVLHDMNIKDCRGNAVRDLAVNAMRGRIVGGQFSECSFAETAGIFSGIYFDSRVKDREVNGVRVGRADRWRRPSLKITANGIPTAGDTITFNGYTVTWVAENPPLNPNEVWRGNNTVNVIRFLERFINNSANAELMKLTTATFDANYFGTSLNGPDLLLLGDAGGDMNAYTVATTSANIALSGSTLAGGLGAVSERWGINGILDGRRNCRIVGCILVGQQGNINPVPDYIISAEAI